MRKHYLVLGLILVIALLVRVIGLNSAPPSLNWDEVSHGYNAYSILKTGHDEWGQFLPITNFRAYGDYPLPFDMYLMMPFILLMDLNQVSIRMPSALTGTLLVLVVYFLTVQIFGKKKLGLLAAFTVALSPWSIMTSRQVLQATPAVFFMSLGAWLILKGYKKADRYFLAGVISLGISAYTYHNTRIFTPLLMLVFLLCFYKAVLSLKTKLILPVVLAAIFFLPLAPVVLSPEGSARAAWVGILDQGAINDINSARGGLHLPSPLPKLAVNKVTYFAYKAGANYLGYFSPQFLALEGGSQYQFSVPGFGVVYPSELLFFYLGLIFLLVRFGTLSPEKKFLLGWLLLAPLPAAITRDPYQVVRANTMLPAFYLVMVFGFDLFLQKLKTTRVRQIAVVLFVVIGIQLFGRYFYNFYFVYPKQYSFAWQYGYQQVAEYIQAHGQSYPQIYISKKYGEPHEFMLFFLKIDPATYQHDPNLVRYFKSDWYWVDRFGKYNFVNDWEVKDKTDKVDNALLITSPGNYPAKGELLEQIDFLNGTPAFDIVKI